MGAAIVYGIVHDQVTAHLCVEYFTVAHPPIFPTQSPFWLAIGWGIIATCWVGLPLGTALALTSRLGPPPRLTLADVRPLIYRLLIVMALSALVAGALGAYFLATGRIQLAPEWAQTIPPTKHVAFMADSWAHLASYATGIIGGLVVICAALWKRTHWRSAAGGTPT